MRQTIKRILREETRPLKAMRRTHLIDREIARLLDRVYYDKRICGRYDDANMFLQVVTEAVVENLYFNTFYMMDDTSLEWESSVNFIYDFIKDSYGEKLKDYFNNICNERAEIDESDPKVGTGKKPKGSGRRLYTDENPSDTVSVKFRTKEDIVDTLNKDSFKSKSHKRQSQIINLIHQRVRAAYQNAKDPETKDRLKRAYDYIETVKEKSKEKTIKLQRGEQNESKKDKDIVCSDCGWSWKLSEGGHDPYTCHKCGNINIKSELTEKCWPGYTQKGMKTCLVKDILIVLRSKRKKR